MPGRRIVVLLALLATVPAAAAAATFFSSPVPALARSCFVAGRDAYRFSTSATARYTVRVDNAALHPALRMQLVDEPAGADFILIDDSASGQACDGAATVSSIRLDSGAAHPDLTVALSRTPAAIKIYVHSARYSPQDAAALFAVMWRKHPADMAPGLRVADRSR